MNWDEEPDSRIVENGKIRIDTGYIKERVVLEEVLTEKLYSYLFIEECPMINIERSLCYEPRHAVIFYNEEDKAYGYIEVCLECGISEADFLHNEICDDRVADLEQIFRDAGIKYFGQE
ncbi:hypothetical protein GWA97_06900 [Flavobacterium sp. LaA7.5]|nr:hypothetical protein [Flavobacterium salilacus subsp. altitudinum]